ncbi:adenosine receptor A2b-like [Sceloporus undulatus]|uniref:adenosine receptor A2b-like n=1 Tax=Sceloporus undulatus TaxID=8520 RepID=UPI001C4C15BE|nr:adenosine receptor A2b-like [Sceloporus undulatus]
MDVYFGFVVLEGILAVAIISTNLLVCATVYLHKELRNVTNYLIVCLAVADLGVGTLAVPFSVVLSMEYVLCFYTCLFLACFPLVTTQFSILLLLVIAINAHLRIKLPNSYAIHVKTRWMMVTVVICWMLSLLIGLSPMMVWNRLQNYMETSNKTLVVSFPSERAAFVIVGHDIPYGDFLPQVLPGRQNFSDSEIHTGHLGRCSFTSIFSSEYLVYFISLTCTLLPLGTMLGIYVDLFRVVRNHFQSQALWPVKRKELQMARTLFLLTGIFCLCWMPLHVTYCVQLLCPSCQRYESLDRLAVLLSHLNSLANPLVYALRKRDFGLALRSVVLRHVLHWPKLKAGCCPSPKVHPQPEAREHQLPHMAKDGGEH